MLATQTGLNQTYATVKHPSKPRSFLDSNGILAIDYGGNVGIVYNPVMLEGQAFKYYEQFKANGNLTAKNNLLNSAEWLIQHVSDKGNYSLWEYSFPWPYYRCLNHPYASATSQAQGMVVLMLAHEITHDNKYLESAKKSFGAFLIDYKQGGVVTRKNKDILIFQEIAKPTYAQTDILNGHIFSVVSLLRYYNYTHDAIVKEVADKGINYLKKYIQTYDAGNWSYFDHFHTYATKNYHLLHISQLDSLFKITHDPIFQQHSKKFALYYHRKQKEPSIFDPGLKVEEVVHGLQFPTTMAFLGPNDILVLEKEKGTIRRIINGSLLPQPLLDLNVAT